MIFLIHPLLGHYGEMSQDEQIELLHIKDEEIDGIKNHLMKEQEVNSHVQMVQEKEILDKERAITFLNKQLNIKQKEVDCLRKLNKKVRIFIQASGATIFIEYLHKLCGFHQSKPLVIGKKVVYIGQNYVFRVN